MFMPVSSFESITGFFGVESVPDSPVVAYMIRLMSATYVGIGVYFIILACRPMDYPVLVPFSGLAAVLLGVVCAITGPIVKMPLLWYLGDALPCILLGALILVFWQRSKKTSNA